MNVGQPERTLRLARLEHSLRRYYPDQVARVDGEASHPLSRIPPAPLVP